MIEFKRMTERVNNTARFKSPFRNFPKLLDPLGINLRIAILRKIELFNQVFGQIGGEEKADIRPLIKEGPIAPGVILQEKLGDRGEVVATIICGDNYFSNNSNKAIEEVFPLINSKSPKILIAGPAFNAGRYGIACGEVCRRASKELGIPCVTGMYRENPGVEM